MHYDEFPSPNEPTKKFQPLKDGGTLEELRHEVERRIESKGQRKLSRRGRISYHNFRQMPYEIVKERGFEWRSPVETGVPEGPRDLETILHSIRERYAESEAEKDVRAMYQMLSEVDSLLTGEGIDADSEYMGDPDAGELADLYTEN